MSAKPLPDSSESPRTQLTESPDRRISQVREVSRKSRSSLTPELVDGPREASRSIPVKPLTRVSAVVLGIAGVLAVLAYQHLLSVAVVEESEAILMMAVGGIALIAAALTFNANLIATGVGLVAGLVLTSVSTHQVITTLGTDSSGILEFALCGASLLSLVLLIAALPQVILVSDSRRSS